MNEFSSGNYISETINLTLVILDTEEEKQEKPYDGRVPSSLQSNLSTQVQVTS